MITEGNVQKELEMTGWKTTTTKNTYCWERTSSKLEKETEGVKGESYYCVYLMIAHNTFSYLIALSEFFSMTAYKSLTLLRYAQSRINIALTATAKSCLLYFAEYCHCLSRIWLQYVIYFYGSLIPLEQGDWTSRKEEWENLCGN